MRLCFHLLCLFGVQPSLSNGLSPVYPASPHTIAKYELTGLLASLSLALGGIVAAFSRFDRRAIWAYVCLIVSVFLEYVTIFVFYYFMYFQGGLAPAIIIALLGSALSYFFLFPWFHHSKDADKRIKMVAVIIYSSYVLAFLLISIERGSVIKWVERERWHAIPPGGISDKSNK